MAKLTQEQLVKYIRALEAKVKKYAVALKRRDEEIKQLKTKVEWLSNGSAETTPSTEKPAEKSPAEEETKQPENKQTFKKPAKVKELEENKPRTFMKKADVGADQRLKEAMEESQEEGKKVSDKEVTDTAPDNDMPGNEDAAGAESDTQTETGAQEDAPAMPSVNFEAGEFLSAVLDGEEEADQMKAQMERLETCEKDERRSVLLSMTKIYWQMVDSMAKRLLSENLPWEKRLFMRFGMLDEKYMPDRMDVWEQLYMDKSKPEDTGIYYIDEWLEEVGRGNLKYSTIDEMALDGRKPDPNATGETALKYERLTVPQMQRMCVGARANTVTIMMQEYCSPARDNPVITRKWLSQTMTEMVKYDHLMFYRKYKGDEFYVQPLFIISPGYGQRAGCWEPWSPGRKKDSGPRICLCAFPSKSSKKALLNGLADYRWEYAKADAMHYWLSEGLTGKWLALFSKKEQRKDLKEVFVDSYFHWVVNESNRRPKLEKRFREFFWHNIPFSDEVKQKLKGGGMFGRLIELEEAKKQREEEERQEIERIKAEREAKKAARQAKLEGN